MRPVVLSGCKGCKHEFLDGGRWPCTKCANNYTNMYEGAKVMSRTEAAEYLRNHINSFSSDSVRAIEVAIKELEKVYDRGR